MPKLPGINHLNAVRALEKVGFHIARQGKHIVMTDGIRTVTKYLSKINCALLGRRSKGSRGSRGSRGRREKELLLHLKNIQINLFTYLQN